ncbi:hypothetical protein LTR60_007368, partial [Cryomyces antarcticus]
RTRSWMRRTGCCRARRSRWRRTILDGTTRHSAPSSLCLRKRLSSSHRSSSRRRWST